MPRLEQVSQPLRLPRDDDDSLAFVEQRYHVVQRILHLSAVDRCRRKQPPEREQSLAGAIAKVGRRKPVDATPQLPPRVVGHRKGGRKIAILDHVRPEAECLVLQGKAGGFHGCHVVDQDQATLWQVVQQGGSARIQVGQVVIQARQPCATSHLLNLLGHTLASSAVTLGKIELCQLSGCGLAPFRKRLAGRRHCGLGNAITAALRRRIEYANGFDLVAKQVDTQRCRRVGGKDIYDATPVAESAGFFHDDAGLIAGLHKRRQQLMQRNHIARVQRAGSTSEGGRRCRFGHQRPCAGDDYVTLAVPGVLLKGLEGCQHTRPCLACLAVPGGPIVE